jgi:hypothetical protein
MAPFDARVGQNPTSALQPDFEIIQLLDRLKARQEVGPELS